MVIPGIKKDMFSKLKKGDAKAVEEHLEKVRKAIKKKEDFMDGTLEELGETIKKPRDEVKQLMKIIKEVEKDAEADLLTLLLAAEVNSRELVISIDEEYDLLEKMEKAKEIPKEMEEGIVIGKIVGHQINLISSIGELNTKIIEKASKLKNKGDKDRVCKNVENLDKIINFLLSIILREEIPNLDIAYNMLKLEEWPEVAAKIKEIQTRFVELEPHPL